MGLLRGFKALWYSTVSLGLLYLGLTPVLNVFGLGSIDGILQGDLRLLLIITGTILLVAIATVFVSGYLVLNGWKGETPVPRKLKLLLAAPVGALVLVIGGAMSFILPIPLVPIVAAALLLWGILRFTSTQVFPPKPRSLDIDTAEQVAFKFWSSRNPHDSGPTPLSATLNGNQWTVVLAGKEETRQLDIDAHTGIVNGWRLV